MNLSRVKDGIYFLYTSWSADSQLHYEVFKEVMKEFSDLEYLTINTDSEDHELLHKSLGILSHGKGEIIWVYNERILFQILNYDKLKIQNLVQRQIVDYNLAYKELVSGYTS